MFCVGLNRPEEMYVPEQHMMRPTTIHHAPGPSVEERSQTVISSHPHDGVRHLASNRLEDSKHISNQNERSSREYGFSGPPGLTATSSKKMVSLKGSEDLMCDASAPVQSSLRLGSRSRGLDRPSTLKSLRCCFGVY